MGKTRAAAAALGLLLAGAAAAQQRPGEDELFGNAPPPPAQGSGPAAQAPPPPGAPGQGGAAGRDEAILGAPAPQGAPAAAQAAQGPPPALTPNENPLSIGGVAYLRLSTTWQEGVPPADWTVLSPNLLDLYADARPNDRVRAFVLGRLLYDPTQASSQFAGAVPGVDASGGGVTPFGGLAQKGGTQALLDQLWVKFDVHHDVFVTAGKQHVKWGVGRFWNPTDYLHPVKRDPLAVYDTRTGTALVKAQVPWESRGGNLYAVALFEDAAGKSAITTLGHVGAGGRVEMALGTGEVGVDALVQNGNKPRFGADVSVGVWDVDLYVEAALRPGVDFAPFVPDPSPPSTASYDQWKPGSTSGFTPQITVGGTWSHKYSDEDSLTVGAEYFYNEAGYSDPHVYSALLVAQVLPTHYPGLPPGSYFTPFYLGKHYAAAFLNLPKPGSWNDWDFTVSVIGNLSDRTFIARLDTGVIVNTYLRVETFVAAHAGPAGGEFRLAFPATTVPYQQATGLPPPYDHVPVNLAIPALAAPILDAGVALRVTL
ncbi:MAG TPA: hypothetical protein VLU43_00555 [Anaeromyxobacteraceae bacterium]|nr:hypothetical protein [Anaeromyxobacteraceae bacterium]